MAASYSLSDNEEMSQQTQPMESRKGKEPLGQCSVTVEESWSRSSAVVSIYRVPDILMWDRVKREAYVPTRVSLGPYHHETEELRSMDSHEESALQRKLRSMESHKKRALQRMTIRFNNIKHLPNDPNNMDFFLLAATEEIRKLQGKIRDNYEEKINWNKDTLAEKLTLDGCFILEILSTLSGNTLPEDGKCYEPLFEKNKILYTGMDILYDMLKLENQIPFIVLLKLLKLQCSSTDSDAENKLREMMPVLSGFYPFEPPKDVQWPWPQPHHHLLGWLHMFIISQHSVNGDDMLHGDIAHSHNGEHARPGQDEESTKINCLNPLLPRICIPGQDEESGEHARNDYMSIPESAKDKDSRTSHHIHPVIELENAGIKFKGEGGIANIKFNDSSNTICLPRITINDSTEILFRNLIAFEMCKPSEGNDVACYVSLMDKLIDSEKDVALLRKRKIITSHLGSDAEVAELFNGLCKGVTVDLERAFHGLTKKVHNKYNNKFRVQLAELVREYFSSPWKTLGLLGGIALLLLSIVQTIVAILALYK